MSLRVNVSNDEYVGLLAVTVGLLVIILPLVYLGPGGFGIGPIGFAVLMMEVIIGIVGVAILGTGVYAYRTGNLRPAIGAVTMICSITFVGVIGAFIEMMEGPLIPIWAWLIAGLLAVGGSIWLTDQFIARQRTKGN